MFTQGLYVNVDDKVKAGYSPLNFFEIERDVYPLSLQVGFVDAILEAGDCLYVPAFYYV